MNRLSRREAIKGLATGVAAGWGLPRCLAGETQPASTGKVVVWPAVDVLVCGGGPAGVAAALMAARAGRKTLLVERYGRLGGMAVEALVGPFMGPGRPAGCGPVHQRHPRGVGFLPGAGHRSGHRRGRRMRRRAGGGTGCRAARGGCRPTPGSRVQASLSGGRRIGRRCKRSLAARGCQLALLRKCATGGGGQRSAAAFSRPGDRGTLGLAARARSWRRARFSRIVV